MLHLFWLPIEGQGMAFRATLDSVPPDLLPAVVDQIGLHGFRYDEARDVFAADDMTPARAAEFMACLSDVGGEVLASGTDGKPPEWIEANPTDPNRRHVGEVPY